MIFLVDIMIPNADYGYQKVAATHKAVEDKEKEKSLILKAHAIVDKHAVGVHLENASLTHTAVVGSSWLEVVALAAFPVPESSEVSHGLGSILH